MNRCLTTIAAIGSLAASTASWSKGDITKITIERVGAGAIEITQPEVLDRFVIWSGPGVVGWDMAKTIPAPDDAAFIVDWTKGVLAGAPDGETYKVTMYVDRYEPPCNKYEVLYRVDESDTGYVYLPRWDEEIGRCNMSLIARDVEGNWFRSSKTWDEAAERFLAFVAPATASSPAECAITTGSPVGNDELLAFSPGKVVFKPGGAGFVDHDGALGIKWPFERLKPGPLFVGGRRLDAVAGPARAYIYDYGESGFQPIYLLFPTPGCWEISAGVGAAAKPVTFVVLVEKIGDGPSGRMNGPDSGRRVTTHWREG
ncbi:MAG TPA: hypothetical protein VGL98_08415 [Gammaproteobacteria bacterium]